MAARVQGALTEALLRLADARLTLLVTSSRGAISQCPANHETIPTPRQSTIKPIHPLTFAGGLDAGFELSRLLLPRGMPGEPFWVFW